MSTVVDRALDNLIESLGDKNDGQSNLIRSMAKRAKIINNHVNIYSNNLFGYGMTVDKFEEYIKTKPNIYILSDKEVEELNYMKELVDILSTKGLQIVRKS